MANMNALKARYFVTASDTNLPTEPIPQQFANCKITPLIDAANYNTAFENALAFVGTGPDAAANARDFILIHNWFLSLSGGVFSGMKGIGGMSGPLVEKKRIPIFWTAPRRGELSGS